MTGFYRDQNVKEWHKGHIWGVFVEQSYCGRGVGHALMAGVLDRARLLPDLAQVQLAVATTRQAARSLYASFGFDGFGIRTAGVEGQR